MNANFLFFPPFFVYGKKGGVRGVVLESAKFTQKEMKKGFFGANVNILGALTKCVPELVGEELTSASSSVASNSPHRPHAHGENDRTSMMNHCVADISPLSISRDKALDIISRRITALIGDTIELSESPNSFERLYGLNAFTSANVDKRNTRVTWRFREDLGADSAEKRHTGLQSEWVTCSVKHECDMYVFVMGCVCMATGIKIINANDKPASYLNNMLQKAANCFEWREYSCPSVRQQEYSSSVPCYMQRHLCMFLKEYCNYLIAITQVNLVDPEKHSEMLRALTKSVIVIHQARTAYLSTGELAEKCMKNMYECLLEDIQVTESWRRVYYCLNLLFGNKCQRYEDEYRCMVEIEGEMRAALTPKIKTEMLSVITKVNADYKFKTYAGYYYMRSATYISKTFLSGSSSSSSPSRTESLTMALFSGLHILPEDRKGDEDDAELYTYPRYFLLIKELLSIK